MKAGTYLMVSLPVEVPVEAHRVPVLLDGQGAGRTFMVTELGVEKRKK